MVSVLVVLLVFMFCLGELSMFDSMCSNLFISFDMVLLIVSGLIWVELVLLVVRVRVCVLVRVGRVILLLINGWFSSFSSCLFCSVVL